ncbi:MAG: T9SS type A sorting domain-containing protein [Saprospiraceae bacterium]
MKIATSTTLFLSITFLVLASVTSSLGQVIYVSQDATGSGSSWQDATGDLRAALASAASGDEVRVSGGTYTPITCSPCTFADRDTRFVLPKGVKLIGGFTAAQGPLEDISNSAEQAQSTTIVTLSGQIETGVAATRSFTVLEAIAPTAGTRIEKINFTNGLANDDTRGSTSRGASGSLLYVTSYDVEETFQLELALCHFDFGESIGYGGAVFVDADQDKKSKLRFSGCSFQDNIAGTGGGAMTISSSFGGSDSSELVNCDFDSNSAGDEGGGGLLIRAAEGGSSTSAFDDVYFVDNNSPLGEGGALRLYGKNGLCSPTFVNCDFANNSAHFGGGIDIDGGYQGVANPVFTGCDFSQNESSNAGGAIYASAVFGGTADFEIYESYFGSNLSGESGGAILVNAIEGSSRAMYRDVEFWSNTATLYGGAVYNLGKSGVCSPSFINCVIADNSASSAGGVYCLGSEGGESSPLILNCVFSDNRADVGGALYSNGNDASGTAEPFVANTIFQYNEAGNGRTLRIIHGRPHLLNCYFDEVDCASLNSGFGGEPVCLGGNIFGDTPDFFDGDRTTPAYNPLPNSPLIDAGNDSILIAHGIFLDLAKEARFRGSSADIGVIENLADNVLWELTSETANVSACEGTSLVLAAAIYPPYPQGEVNWIVGADTVSRETTYTIDELTNSQNIQVSGSLFGESRSLTVDVNVLPTLITSLTSDASSLPDTLCLDSTYQLTASANAVNIASSFKWFDEDENLLAETKVLTLSPTSTLLLKRTVVAEFVGTCLDSNSRSISYNFDVANCGVSSTQQASDFEGLTLFPNPTKDAVSITGLSGDGQFDVQILNSTGQTVYSGTMSASNTTLNVYSLPQGLYFIIVRDEQTIYRGLLEKA